MNLFRRQFLHLAAGALTLGTARAEDQTYVMKISGPTINDAPHLFMKNYAAAIQKDSGERIRPEVYPASQLGSSHGRSRALSSAPSRQRIFRPNFLSASTNDLK